MTIEELKRIQLYRQHLTSPADKIAVVRDLCGIQCQYLSNAYHSLCIRCGEDLNIDIFGKSLVKNWSLRGTVHIFAEDDLPVFKYDDGFYRNEQWQGERYCGHIWVSAEREKFFADYIIQCVKDGIDTRNALREKCRYVGMTLREEAFIFDSWGGLLRPLCERGFLTYKVQEKKAFAIAPIYSPLPRNEALKIQFQRYLEHIAPATLHDIAYFFGFSQTQVKKVLSSIPVKSFLFEGVEYFYSGKLNTDYPPIPECLLLAGFDQLMLGYEKKESHYLPQEYVRGIFNLAGIVMPSVLLGGHVAGKWKRKNRVLEITCFRTITSKEKAAVEERAKSIWKEGINEIQYKSP